MTETKMTLVVTQWHPEGSVEVNRREVAVTKKGRLLYADGRSFDSTTLKTTKSSKGINYNYHLEPIV